MFDCVLSVEVWGSVEWWWLFGFVSYGAWEVGLLCFLGPRVDDGVRRLAWLDLGGVFMIG